MIMKSPKTLDMSDEPLDDPESDYEEAHTLDFNKDHTLPSERKVGDGIYESIEDELPESSDDDVLRDLPEFDIPEIEFDDLADFGQFTSESD